MSNQTKWEEDETNRLKEENKKLRRAVRLMYRRGQVQSGSKEMADIDAYCKTIGLYIWQWPLDIF